MVLQLHRLLQNVLLRVNWEPSILAVWLAIEIKGREGAPVFRDGQTVLRDQGGIWICQSFDDVMKAVEHFEGALNV